MKSLILLAFALLVGLFIRLEAIQFGKLSYADGCFDATRKLFREQHIEQAKMILAFCNARSLSIHNDMDKFL